MKQGNRSVDFAESAFKLFSARGLDAVTMDAIAAERKATKGSLYWHYKSKDEVIEASCDHYYQQWHKTAQRAIFMESDSVEKLRIMLRESVRSCLIDSRNRVFTMEVITRSLYDQEIRQGWRQFFDSVRTFYLDLVESAIESGALSLDEPEVAVDVMLSVMEGYKLRAVFEPELCSKAQEAAITEQLLGLLNIHTIT